MAWEEILRHNHPVPVLVVAALLLAAASDYPQSTVSVGDHRIAFHTMGTQGPPIVAIPGGPGFAGRSLWSFGYEMQDVARVYLFDQLGTGGSRMKDSHADISPRLTLDQTIEDLEALRAKLGHDKWTVFGQSWGVHVALHYAARHPERVDRLILASVPGMGSSEYQVFQTNLGAKLPTAVKDRIEDISLDNRLSPDQKREQAVFETLPYYFFDPEEGCDFAALAPAGLFSPRVFATMFRYVNDASLISPLPDQLKAWKGHALILQGHQDPTGAAMGYRLRDRFLPSAEVVMFDRAGHFSWMEEETTDSFFYILRNWMDLPLRPEYESKNTLTWETALELIQKRKSDGWPFGVKQKTPSERSALNL